MAKTQRERDQAAREAKLERIKDQVDNGDLTIRKMSDEERAKWAKHREETETTSSPAGGPAQARAEVGLLAPVPRPRAIFGVGLNSAAHARETGQTPPEAPMIFMKLPSSAAAPNAGVAIPPAAASRLDYEGELAIV